MPCWSGAPTLPPTILLRWESFRNGSSLRLDDRGRGRLAGCPGVPFPEAPSMTTPGLQQEKGGRGEVDEVCAAACGWRTPGCAPGGRSGGMRLGRCAAVLLVVLTGKAITLVYRGDRLVPTPPPPAGSGPVASDRRALAQTASERESAR